MYSLIPVSFRLFGQNQIWDIAKRKIRHLFEGHTQEIYSLDFSRDGKLIVSGSGDKTARIWDMETGACKVLAIIEPESIDAGVTSVAISPDGRWVAAGSLDMVVRIWDASTGALVERLRGHKDSVYSVAFSPDGRGLVSGSLDKSLKYWDIMPMVRAVTSGAQAGGANRVLLRQDGLVASNQGPVPGGKKDGGGEMGSSCTVAFTGHKVRFSFLWSFVGRLCGLRLLFAYNISSRLCRTMFYPWQCRLMERGSFPAQRIVVSNSGIPRMRRRS